MTPNDSLQPLDARPLPWLTHCLDVLVSEMITPLSELLNASFALPKVLLIKMIVDDYVI